MKPELGKVAVGDRLLVIIPTYSNRAGRPDPIEAVVTKVGRVWIEMESTEPRPVNAAPRTWKLRMDTQTDGGGSYSTRFVTAAQNVWDLRVGAAAAYLREIELYPNHASPWSAPEQKLILANLLRAHGGLPEI